MTSTQPQTIASLADLRPGDVMFSKIGGFIPGVFPVKAGQLMLGESMRIGRRSFDHVGIVVQAATWPWTPTGAMPWGQGPRIVQAMPGGAEEVEIGPNRHWTDTVAYCRLPEDYPGQAADAAAIARLFVSEGVRYSFLSYGALALFKWGKAIGGPGRDDIGERLAKWIGRRGEPLKVTGIDRGNGKRGDFMIPGLPVEAICSVLVDQCWTLAGHKVVSGTRPQIVTPGMLAMQLWNRPGVVRGGKDVLW